jgi:hypothetical protein
MTKLPMELMTRQKDENGKNSPTKRGFQRGITRSPSFQRDISAIQSDLNNMPSNFISFRAWIVPKANVPQMWNVSI